MSELSHAADPSLPSQDAAKALVSAQNKAKKDRIKDDVALTNAVATAKKEGKAAAPERKRVSFA